MEQMIFYIGNKNELIYIYLSTYYQYKYSEQ